VLNCQQHFIFKIFFAKSIFKKNYKRADLKRAVKA